MSPAPWWLRPRTPEVLAEERAHLEAMRRREREAIAAGFQVRPKVPEKSADREDSAL